MFCSSNLLLKSISFLGSGKMAQAIAYGMAPLPDFDEILMCDIHQSQLDAIKKHPKCTEKFKFTQRAKDTIKTDVTVLSIHPHESADLLTLLGPEIGKDHLIVSIMAGVPIATIRTNMRKNTKARIIRCMPNIALQVGCGTTALCTDNATKEDCDMMQNMFSQIGYCTLLSERQLNVVPGISGSSPAFVAEFIEALALGGVLEGVSHPVALKLAAHAVLGAAAMIANESLTCAELRDNVCTPGGCSITGLYTLEKHGFKNAVIEAVKMTTEKVKELGCIKAKY